MEVKIQKILEPGEQVFWQGNISRKVLFLQLFISLAIIMLAGGFLLNFGPNMASKIMTDNNYAVLIEFIADIGGLAVLILGTLYAFIKLFLDMIKEYAITDKRIILKSGFIGTDFKSIYNKQIKSVLVDVNLLGKILSTGNIKIDVGQTETFSMPVSADPNAEHQTQTQIMYAYLREVDKPYEVYKSIKVGGN